MNVWKLLPGKKSPGDGTPPARRASKPTESVESANRSTGIRISASTYYPPLEGSEIEKEDDEEEDEEYATTDGDSPRGSPTSSKDSGVVWHARILPDDCKDPRSCLPSGEVKPLRPIPCMTVSALIDGLRRQGGAWVFEGPMNGWPALTRLELRSLTSREAKLGIPSIKRIWMAGGEQPLPPKKDFPRNTRATFVAPGWTQVGWAPDSPGFVMWFTQRRAGAGEKLLYGEKMLMSLQAEPYARAQATTAHAFVHRYAAQNETLRDRQTWHAVLLLEWDHRKFTTLVELAWLNGLGGYRGKSNWCDDKLAPETALYSAMPPALKMPYSQNRSEVRVIEMDAKNREEFEAFLRKFSEKGELPHEEQRFLEPKLHMSTQVRLRSCTALDLAGYLLNYQHRAPEYHQLRQNCQTFVADLYAFLTGSKDVQPYGNIIKPGYSQRSKGFLYLPGHDDGRE